MRILIDIGHPAHIHYFRNLIKIMKSKGHDFVLVARNRKYVPELLEHYSLDYKLRNSGYSSLAGKLFGIVKTDYEIYKVAKLFKPDLFLGSKSIYLAHASKVMRKPCIVITDTEVSNLEDKLASPFIDSIITPSCFKKDFGDKHIRLDTYFEMNYLHPNYYSPNKKVFEYLNLKEGEKFAIIRFVKWSASHDVGQKGISYQLKKNIIELLSRNMRVYISSEIELLDELKRYQIQVPYHLMHDALYFASLFVGEGATMASECAILGTPAIYINSQELSTTTEQEEKYDLVFNFRDSVGVINKIKELINEINNGVYESKNKQLIADKINMTPFMVWFVENYPNSAKIMKENPDYQHKFK